MDQPVYQDVIECPGNKVNAPGKPLCQSLSSHILYVFVYLSVSAVSGRFKFGEWP